MELNEQQEIVAAISDMIIDTYASESVLLRALKRAERGYEQMMQVFINDAVARMEVGAKYILAAVCNENEFAATLQALQKLLKWRPIDTFQLRRSIAQRIIEAESYPWS